MKQPSSQTALKKLRILHAALGPDVAFFIEPNMVLTLAGARGTAEQITYYDYAKMKQWVIDVFNQAKKIENKLGLKILPQVEKNASGESWAGCELINPEGLSWALSQTSLIKTAVLPQNLDTFEDFLKWYEIFRQEVIATRPEWKNNEAAKNDVPAGITLGYPDAAILSILDETEANYSNYIDADIKDVARYACPQPVYSYDKKLKDNPEIVKHQKLWNQILDEVYESDWHRKLAKDPGFLEKRSLIEAF